MEFDFSVSEDTQAVLLLCGALGRGDREITPLTTPQYNAFACALRDRGRRPADLIADGLPNEELIDACCVAMADRTRVKPVEKTRVCALLRRGVTLSTALDKWASYGVRVVGRADAHYPKRLRKHLGGNASPILYFAGNEDLLSGGGMAFVGSRDINEDASEMIRSVVRDCVGRGLNVVSGGARGADQTAMQEAFFNGGKVVGAVPCYLLKACLDPSNREALASGNALLFSAFDPEARPFRYGVVAMDRNKYIYGMADACFVAQSGVGPKSGTWTGAVEELKRENHHPVYVYMAANPSDGCSELAKKGALKWDLTKSFDENLRQADAVNDVQKGMTKATHEIDLFTVVAETNNGFANNTSEPPIIALTSGVENITTKEPDEHSPYASFVTTLQELLFAPRKDTELKKRLAKKCDLVTAQVNRWIDRATDEGIVIRKEYPGSKKPCVMFECKRV